MSQQTVIRAPEPETVPRARRVDAPRGVSRGTARLLTAGIVAGPLFVVVWALQALSRDGFDPARHPLSLLSLGDLGWIQITNFVLTGALFIACARGLRRALRPGPGGTWGPRLVGALGVGLIVAGVFVADAGAGFPAGAPAGTPEMTWHGALHEVGSVLAGLSWIAACLVFSRRFAADGQRGWALACVATLVATLMLVAWPDLASLAPRTVLATAIQFGLVAAVAWRLRKGEPDATSPASAAR